MSHSPDRIKELILKSLIVALVPLLVYLLTANYWVIKEFNDLFYDSLLRLRGRSRDTSIVIVKIDDYSLQRYGHWPWPRRKLAAGISQIRGENLLALDLLFAEPTNSFDDSVLVDALMRHKKVVLAVGFQRKPVYPILPLLARASGLAHVIVAPSMDGVIRRMYSFQECSEEQILWAYPIEVVRVENDLPIDSTVKAAADMLGFDLLNIANEGKVVIVVSPDCADAVIAKCKANEYGAKAAIIGEVLATDDSHDPIVEITTTIGGSRIVQMPYGRELPRIC